MLSRRIDWPAIGLGVSVLAGVWAVFNWWQPPQIEAVREAVYDQYQRWKPREYWMTDPSAPGETFKPPVRVIDIDEESLKQLGQWPWPRTFLAELIYRVTNAGAAAIAFDMTFAEPDRTSPGVLIPSLRRFGDVYDYSGVF